MAARLRMLNHPFPAPFSLIFTCPYISRAQGLSCCRLSTSSKKITYQKSGKDEPVAFSKSKAKFHSVDDTLGISKPKKSNFPLFLGLTLFTVIIYFGFIRKEPYSSPAESLEELLERIRISHEEKLKNQTEKINETNEEGSD